MACHLESHATVIKCCFLLPVATYVVFSLMAVQLTMFCHYWKTQFNEKEENTQKNYSNFQAGNLLKGVVDLNLRDQLTEIC